MGNAFLRVYRSLALHVLNTAILFILLNVAAWGFGKIYESKHGPAKYNVTLDRAYPGKSPDEIRELLAESWPRQLTYEPFTIFKEAPSTGRYVNYGELFRKTEDQGPWPPSPEFTNVFMFGGSTVMGYGLTDNETIPSFLQAELQARLGTAKTVKVYNFGRGHYFSTQERILFEQLYLDGIRPKAAVFLDGLNDFYYCDGVPPFRAELEQLISGRGQYAALGSLPLIGLVSGVMGRVSGEQTVCMEGQPGAPEAIDGTIARMKSNREIIAQIASAGRITTRFFLQPVPVYGFDLDAHLFRPFLSQRDYFVGVGYKRYFESKGGSRDEPQLISLAGLFEKDNAPLYVDRVHYGAEAAHRLAVAIADEIATSL